MESDLPLRGVDASSLDLVKGGWAGNSGVVGQPPPQLEAPPAAWLQRLAHEAPTGLAPRGSAYPPNVAALPAAPVSLTSAVPAVDAAAMGGNPWELAPSRTLMGGTDPAGARAAPRATAATTVEGHRPSRSVPPARLAPQDRSSVSTHGCSSSTSCSITTTSSSSSIAAAAAVAAAGATTSSSSDRSVTLREAEPELDTTSWSLRSSTCLSDTWSDGAAPHVHTPLLPSVASHVYLAPIACRLPIESSSFTEHAQLESAAPHPSPSARTTPPRADTIPEPRPSTLTGVKEENTDTTCVGEILDEFFNPPGNDGNDMSDSEPEIIDDSETDLTGDLIISDETKIIKYYEDRFKLLQQIPCKSIAKDWIKAIEPKKQARYPYNGGKIAKKTASPRDETSKDPGELTRPPWWPPEGCPHREPDHIHKHQRLVLLMHLLRGLWLPDDIKNRKPYQCIDVSVLRKSTEKTAQAWAHQKKYEDNARYLEEIYEMRYYEEQYRCGGYYLNTTITFRLSPSSNKQDTKRQRREIHFIEPEVVDPKRDPNRAYRPVTVTSPLRQEFRVHSPSNQRPTLPLPQASGTQASRHDTQPDQYQSRNNNVQRSNFPPRIATVVDGAGAAPPTWLTSTRSPTRKRSAGTMVMGEYDLASAPASDETSESQVTFPDRSRDHNVPGRNSHRSHEEGSREMLTLNRLPSLASSIPREHGFPPANGREASYPHHESSSSHQPPHAHMGSSVANWPYMPLPMPNHQPPRYNWTESYRNEDRNRGSFSSSASQMPPINSIYPRPPSSRGFDFPPQSRYATSPSRWR